MIPGTAPCSLRVWCLPGSRWTWIPLVFSIGAHACNPCCVNECTRTYWLVDPGASASFGQSNAAELGNVSETDNECEIDDHPLSIAERRATLLVETEPSKGTRPTPVLFFREAFDAPPDEVEQCEGLPTFASVEALTSAELAEGSEVCVEGWVETSTYCTDVGCGI